MGLQAKNYNDLTRKEKTAFKEVALGFGYAPCPATGLLLPINVMGNRNQRGENDVQPLSKAGKLIRGLQKKIAQLRVA